MLPSIHHLLDPDVIRMDPQAPSAPAFAFARCTTHELAVKCSLLLGRDRRRNLCLMSPRSCHFVTVTVLSERSSGQYLHEPGYEPPPKTVQYSSFPKHIGS
ncbi:hypothetical protein PMIN06_012767 [Paraphaeosphaeria minitans]